MLWINKTLLNSFFYHITEAKCAIWIVCPRTAHTTTNEYDENCKTQYIKMSGLENYSLYEKIINVVFLFKMHYTYG